MVDLHSLPPDELDRLVQPSKASSALPDEPDMAVLLGQILRKAAEPVAATGYHTRSIIAAPILIGGAVCGTIELLNRADGEPYDARDLLLLLQIFARPRASSTDGADAGSLIRGADAAMYRAKGAWKNSVVIARPGHSDG